MKRIFSLILLGVATIFLVACSNQNSLDGKYYDIYDGEAELILEFDGSGGKFYEEGTHAITDIDTDNQTFTFSANGREFVVTYNLKEDGTLEYDTGDFLTSGNADIAYKKDSEAYKEALNN